MNILEINKQTLYNLYEQFPESFSELTLDGTNLVYHGESVDISNFNINDLLTPEISFASSLSVLSSEDIFTIIRLHALKLDSVTKDQNEQNTEKKVEIIKSENPLMKNISVVSRTRNGITEEFLMIVDSDNKDHLFKNDRNVNLFAIYETLKYESANQLVTPDELIAAIERKLYQINMTDVRDINATSTTTEEFEQKMNIANKPFKDDKRHSVYGNEDYDIAVVADSYGTDHQVITFDHNQYGDLVMENHNPNVTGSDTSLKSSDTNESIGFTSEVNENTETQVQTNSDQEIVARLISSEEFYRLINSSEDLSERQRRDVDLYYSYIGDLIIYEDYLLSDLRQMLNEFRSFVYDLEFGEHEKDLNELQQEAIDKNYKLEEKKAQSISSETMEQINNEVKKLELIRESSSTNNTGSISTIQVIALIVGISIILTAITLYLIK